MQDPPRADLSFIDMTESGEVREALRRSLEREQRRSRQLQSLAEAALLITSSRTLDSVLQTITDQARTIIGAHQAATSLTNDGDWSQSIKALSLSEKYAAWRGSMPAYSRRDSVRLAVG